MRKKDSVRHRSIRAHAYLTHTHLHHTIHAHAHTHSHITLFVPNPPYPHHSICTDAHTHTHITLFVPNPLLTTIFVPMAIYPYHSIRTHPPFHTHTPTSYYSYTRTSTVASVNRYSHTNTHANTHQQQTITEPTKVLSTQLMAFLMKHLSKAESVCGRWLCCPQDATGRHKTLTKTGGGLRRR